MAAPMENTSREENEQFCEIEATVNTGFESVAIEEAAEKLKCDVTSNRGRIVMKVPLNKVKKVLDLGCIDNCYVLMTKEENFTFSDDELECMSSLRELVKRVDWEIGLKAWQQVFSFKHPIKTKPDVIPDVLGEPVLSSRIHKPQKGDNGGKKSRRQKKKEKKEQRKAERQKLHEQNVKILDTCIGDATKEDTSKENDSDSVIDKNTDLLSETCNKSENVSTRLQASDDTSNRNKNVEISMSTSEEKQETTPSIIEKTDQEKSDSEPQAKKPKLTEYSPDKPAFRVTCQRTGDHHPFDSMGAQSNFGGAIYNYFKWNVSMKEFDIEVMLYIDNSDVRVGLALTKESLHRRNTISFGPTTLRPTIAYNMLRMCKIQPGEVICDPLCGSGVIPIQAALDWPDSIHICGELVNRALNRTVENIEYVNKLQTETEKSPINLAALRWNSCNLPLKDSSVDVFISDLPFGVRMGSKSENSTLYPRVLHEMSRVTKPGTGRICLLTQDKKGINRAIQMVSKYWKRTNAVGINMGGLAACVYMLYRNSKEFDKTAPLEFPSGEENTKIPPIVQKSPINENSTEQSGKQN